MFELDKNAASINQMGAVKRQEEDYCSFGRARGFMADEAVHFFVGSRVLSSFWDTPEVVSEMVLGDVNQDCYFISF